MVPFNATAVSSVALSLNSMEGRGFIRPFLFHLIIISISVNCHYLTTAIVSIAVLLNKPILIRLKSYLILGPKLFIKGTGVFLACSRKTVLFFKMSSDASIRSKKMQLCSWSDFGSQDSVSLNWIMT